MGVKFWTAKRNVGKSASTGVQAGKRFHLVSWHHSMKIHHFLSWTDCVELLCGGAVYPATIKEKPHWMRADRLGFWVADPGVQLLEENACIVVAVDVDGRPAGTAVWETAVALARLVWWGWHDTVLPGCSWGPLLSGKRRKRYIHRFVQGKDKVLIFHAAGSSNGKT